MFGLTRTAVISLLLLATSSCLCKSSDISFSPLPPVPEPVSRPRDTSHGLAGFFSLGSSVVDSILPDNLPHDTVTDLISTLSDQLQLDWGIPPSDTDLRGVVNECLTWLAPMLAAMMLGSVLAVGIPVVGCCILCCRACGRCGAKSRIYRKKNQNCKCASCTGLLLLTTTMIFVGAIIGAVSVRHVSESLREAETTVDTALNDIDSYTSNASQQVFFIANDQYGVFESYVLNDIDHVGEWFEVSIGVGFKSNALSVMDEASSLLSELRALDELVIGGNDLIDKLRNNTHHLKALVSRLDAEMDHLNMVCTDIGLNSSVCSFSTHFSVTVNFTDIKDIEFNDEANFSSIQETIHTATDMFYNMAGFINMEAKNYGLREKAESEFINAHNTLQSDFLNDFNDTIQNMVSDIDSTQTEVSDALQDLNDYIIIWDAFGLLLLSVFFLLTVVFTIGSFCGSFGYSGKAQPHARSSVSHCGGRCILVGVVIAFVASPVLLMTTAASLGLAGGIEKVCEDLEAPEYTLFKEVVDDPNVWGGVTLVGLVTRELTNTVVNISIHQSLSRCAQNEAIWMAFDADTFSTTSDFNSAFNCSSFGIGNEEFTPFKDIKTEDIFPQLEHINESFSGIDFSELLDTINSTEFLSFDTEELQTYLTGIISASGNDTLRELALLIRDHTLVGIQNTVNNISLLRDTIKSDVNQLQNMIGTSEEEMVTFTNKVNSLLTELDRVVNKATGDYVTRLCGFVDEYINYANDTIRNEVGRCGVFADSYAAVYDTVCKNAVDGLNGYWLAVGWCMLFTMVGVVIGIILSDYFRRASTRVVRCHDTSSIVSGNSETASLLAAHHIDDQEEEVSLINMSPKGESHLSNGTKPLPEDQQPLQTTNVGQEW